MCQCVMSESPFLGMRVTACNSCARSPDLGLCLHIDWSHAGQRGGRNSKEYIGEGGRCRIVQVPFKVRIGRMPA